MSPTPATLADLAAVLSPYAALPLVFSFRGEDIRPGYHVTELKAARIDSIDCGGRVAAFRETVVQLLDGRRDAQEVHMTAGRFLAIADRSRAALPGLADAPLIFEYGPGNRPALRLAIARIERTEAALRVHLSALHAACRPALEARTAAAAGEAPTADPCCGVPGALPAGAAACCA